MSEPPGSGADEFNELIVCSLEPWDDIWRRNQFLVDELLRRNPALRVLFVEPVIDVAYDLLKRRRPARGGLREVRNDGRLFAVRPRKIFPRVLARRFVEWHLVRQVRLQARRLGFSRPVLWINDDSYAALAERVSWPTLHDMTDDWLAAAATGRELGRRRGYEASLSSRADVRVAVSPRLVANRGSPHSIRLIPDGVDVDHFRQEQARPGDVPDGLFALYVGTLHEDRIDLELVVDLARSIAPASVVLVGPNAMSPASTRRLQALGNCYLLGPRPYAQVPAYYQHADVIVVPHRVSDFTESLDPIKVYECLAVGRPTVSTPVAGFRGLGPPVEVVDAAEFPEVVRRVLDAPPPAMPGSPPTWTMRAESFEAALREGVRARLERSGATT